MSTSLPVSEATEEAPSASATGLRTASASGPDLQAHAGCAVPDRGGQARRRRRWPFHQSTACRNGLHAPPARRRAPPRRAGSARTAGRLRYVRSQHRHVGRLLQQDASRQLARRLVDLEMRGGGVRISESSLQWGAVVYSGAAGKVVHVAHHVGGSPYRVSCRQTQSVSRLDRHALAVLGSPATQSRSPGSTVLALRSAPTPRSPRPLVWRGARPVCGSTRALSWRRPAR